MAQFYKRHKLDKAIAQAGIVKSTISAYEWIRRKEASGRLVSPLDPVTKHRRYTSEQITEIV